MKFELLEKLVREKVESLFRTYDLKPQVCEEQCEQLTEWVLQDIKAHPCCEELLHSWNSTEFYFLQIALENITKANKKGE